jgi:hypothetical protein
MRRLVFISYNFNDRECSHNILSFFQEKGGPCQGKPQFVSGGSSFSNAEIDNAIRSAMELCEAGLFIIGDNNHNSPWIAREAQLAASLALPLVAVRLLGTDGGLPRELAPRSVPFVEWSPQKVAIALNPLSRRAARPGS